MSDVKGVVRTAYDARPREMINPDRAGGVVQHMYDEYEAVALEAGSTIKVGVPLPIGARIKNVTVFHDDLGSTNCTLQVGDSDATNRYLAAFATGSAGKQDMTGTYGAILGWFYQITGDDEDTDIIITTAGSAANGTIKIDVEYVMV